MADIEKAMKLAYGPEWRDRLGYGTANEAWEYSVFWLARGGNQKAALGRAILALALCEDSTNRLGRWNVNRYMEHKPEWRFECGLCYAMQTCDGWKINHLAPLKCRPEDQNAYLDGSAQELLLLMAAADELRRRMEAER